MGGLGKFGELPVDFIGLKRRGLMGEWAQYCKETAIFETVTATDRSDVVAERRRTG